MAHLYGPGPGDPPALISTTDLAGLSASDVDGRPVGELFGALSEERSGLIRYLDVSVRDAGKHVLVPIGHVRIDREAVPPRIRLRAATQEDLISVPAFERDTTALSSGYHEQVMSAHGRLFYGTRYYAHPAYDHEALQAGAGMVIEAEGDGAGEPAPGLQELSTLSGFRIARSAPDLVGWTLIGSEGETVGTIRDLLVDSSARRARYAVVELDALDRATAVPIGYLEADGDGTTRLTTLTRQDIRLLPAYEGPPTRAQENRIHATIEGRLSGARYFDRPDFQPARPPD